MDTSNDINQVVFTNNQQWVNFCGGEHHSLGLTDTGNHYSNVIGALYAFGRGDSGQLGLDDNKSYSTPQLVPLKHVTRVSAGGAFTLATTEQGVFGWGYGEMGQLGNNSVDESAPTPIALNGRVVLDAKAGGQHTLLLLKPKET